jgi:hypothetical protein
VSCSTFPALFSMTHFLIVGPWKRLYRQDLHRPLRQGHSCPAREI